VPRARVVLTPRGWGLLAGGFLALLLGALAVSPLILLIGVVVSVFAGGEVVVFAFATRWVAPDALSVRRYENSSQLAVDGLGTMALEIERGPGPGAYVEVFDRTPEPLRPVVGTPRLATWWASGRPVRLAYAYRADRRGAYEIGPVIVVAHDPIGLAFRIATLEGRWPVEAVPQAAYWRADLTERLRSAPLGQVLVDLRGRGSEFRSLREYEASDDFRTIVWKRSTFERLYVRESESENRNEIALLLDTSRAMAVGLPGGDALDQAVDAALLIARYAFSQGDHVALLLHSDQPQVFLPLGRRIDHSVSIDRALAAATCTGTTFRFGSALQLLGDRLSRPTAIFAFTALGSEPPIEVVARLRSAGHRLFVFVPDPIAQFPPLPDPFHASVVEFSSVPERARQMRAVEIARARGIPTSTYGRAGLPDLVASQFAQLRAGAAGG
jgi:uncharacterized protein (DUF58 family)